MNTLRRVLSKPAYIILAIVTTWLVFTIAVWLPNWQLLINILPSSMATISEKVLLLWSLYGSIGTNFTLLSESYTILIAILFGINLSLFVYFIRARQGEVSGTHSATSIGGLISGLFGLGCTACGTFLLSIVLGMFGGAWIITLLPLGGGEFGILGVLLLGYSIYAIIRKINTPLVCKE